MSSNKILDFEQLFNDLPYPHLVIKANSPEFTLVGENIAHAKVAMVNKNDVIGKPFFKVFPDTTEKYKSTGISDVKESLQAVIDTGEPHVLEPIRYDIKNTDGEYEERYWQATHYPLFDQSGKVEYIFQQTEDITDKIESDTLLLQTRKQLEEALSVGAIGTWFWNIKTNILTADKNLAFMFGVPAEEASKGLLLEKFTDSIYIHDRPRIMKKISEAVDSLGSFEEEYRTISTDGSIRWVMARGKVEADKNGKPEFFPGVIFDITGRKDAENKLQLLAEASAALSELLDYNKTLQNVASIMVPSFADWVSVDLLNSKGQVELVAVHHKDPKKIAWAKKYRKHTGAIDLKAASGVGKVIREGIAEYYPNITPELLDKAAQNDEERKLARELGICSGITVPLTSEGKTVGAISFIATDNSRHYTLGDLEMAKDLAARASLAITNAALYDQTKQELLERENLQDQLREANEKLEKRVLERTNELEAANVDLGRSNQELQDFAYVASHDLQEPLRKIQAFGDILHEEYASKLGDGDEYLVRMQSAAARMSVLIEDLLEFSRVTTHAKKQTNTDLNRLIPDVLEDLEKRIDDTNAKITVDKLPTLKAEATQMRQLFQNLIGNALKFHHPDRSPEITVSSKKIKENDTNWNEIRVSDNGIGFDEKYLDRIFSVFQRLHGRESFEGTGIGLAVCRKIVERHHGFITAESQLGVGSTFIIKLPLSE